MVAVTGPLEEQLGARTVPLVDRLARVAHDRQMSAEPGPEPAFDSPGVDGLRHDGAVVRLQVRSGLDAVIKTIARYPVIDFRTEQPSLEDLFLAFYEEPADEKEAERVPA